MYPHSHGAWKSTLVESAEASDSPLSWEASVWEAGPGDVAKTPALAMTLLLLLLVTMMIFFVSELLMVRWIAASSSASGTWIGCVRAGSYTGPPQRC